MKRRPEKPSRSAGRPRRHGRGNRDPREDARTGSGRGGPQAAIFVDHSNIWIGLERAAASNGERRGIRLDHRQLRRLLAAGRPIATIVAVVDAEVPAPIRRSMTAAGFEVITRERGRLTGTEQANDETLLVRLYETIATRPPGVLVLATGDGAGSHEDHGFVAALRAARGAGWGIEVAAWPDSLNPRLRSFVEANGGVFLDLEDYYFALADAPDSRRSSTVPLVGRSIADATVALRGPTIGHGPMLGGLQTPDPAGGIR